jgi:hypothetical protein
VHRERRLRHAVEAEGAETMAARAEEAVGAETVAHRAEAAVAGTMPDPAAEAVAGTMPDPAAVPTAARAGARAAFFPSSSADWNGILNGMPFPLLSPAQSKDLNGLLGFAGGQALSTRLVHQRVH